MGILSPLKSDNIISNFQRITSSLELQSCEQGELKLKSRQFIIYLTFKKVDFRLDQLMEIEIGSGFGCGFVPIPQIRKEHNHFKDNKKNYKKM